MRNTILLAAATAALCHGALATADNGTNENTDENLQQLVVTATRSEQTLERTLAPILVIDREEIELSQASDVADLLRFHAGLEIARNGGAGQATSLFVRGTDSNQVLVLIDGIKINPGTIGGAPFQNIRPEIIQRIEVVKGPRSSLYGSDAIGGVINIITRTAADTQFSAGAGAGRYNSWDLSADVSVTGKHGSVTAMLSRFETDGFPTLASSSIDRGYENDTIQLGGNAALGQVGLSANVWQSAGTSEYLDFFGAPLSQDYEDQALSVTADLAPTDNWNSQVKLGYMSNDIEQNQSADYVVTRRRTLDWFNSFQVGEVQQISAGVYFSNENDQSMSFGSGFDRDRDDQAIYVADQLSWGRQQLLIAARHSDFDSFGNETTWNTDYGYYIGDSGLITASAGTGFRAPDATDLYGFGGNSNLLPETSKNFELGYRWQINRQTSASFHAFHNEIDNLIEFVITDPVTFAGMNENIAKARIRGVEGSWRYQNDDWDLRSSMIVQDPQNVTDDQQLLRRSKRSLTAAAVRKLGAIELGMDVLVTDKRADFGGARLGGYTLINVNSRYQISKALQMRIKVENLLNKNYQTAQGFNSAKQSVYLAFDYRLSP